MKSLSGINGDAINVETAEYVGCYGYTMSYTGVWTLR